MIEETIIRSGIVLSDTEEVKGILEKFSTKMGMSLSAVAKELGVSRVYLSYVANGKRPAKALLPKLQKLADTYALFAETPSETIAPVASQQDIVVAMAFSEEIQAAKVNKRTLHDAKRYLESHGYPAPLFVWLSDEKIIEMATSWYNVSLKKSPFSPPKLPLPQSQALTPLQSQVAPVQRSSRSIVQEKKSKKPTKVVDVSTSGGSHNLPALSSQEWYLIQTQSRAVMPVPTQGAKFYNDHQQLYPPLRLGYPHSPRYVDEPQAEDLAQVYQRVPEQLPQTRALPQTVVTEVSEEQQNLEGFYAELSALRR